MLQAAISKTTRALSYPTSIPLSTPQENTLYYLAVDIVEPDSRLRLSPAQPSFKRVFIVAEKSAIEAIFRTGVIANNDPVNKIDKLGKNAVEEILKDNPRVAEIQFNIQSLNAIRRQLLTQGRQLGGRAYAQHIAAASAVGREKLQLQRKLEQLASNAEYRLLLDAFGNDEHAIDMTAIIQGTNAFGFKYAFETFSRDTIFGKDQTIWDRIQKGGLGLVEIGGIAIPIGRLSGQALTRISGKTANLIKTRLPIAPKNTARYVFDSRTGQYRDAATGRFVSARDLPWPSNRGFSSSTQGTLKPGTVIDRFGKPSGRYAGQPGATVSQRRMAQGADAAQYTQYEVLRPLPAEIGPAAPVPAFGAEGGATQYLFQQSIGDLVEQGFLRVVK